MAGRVQSKTFPAKCTNGLEKKAKSFHLMSPRVCTKACRSSGLVPLLFKLSSRKAKIWSSCSCGTYGERVAARHKSCLEDVKLNIFEEALLLLIHGSQASALW